MGGISGESVPGGLEGVESYQIISARINKSLTPFVVGYPDLQVQLSKTEVLVGKYVSGPGLVEVFSRLPVVSIENGGPLTENPRQEDFIGRPIHRFLCYSLNKPWGELTNAENLIYYRDELRQITEKGLNTLAEAQSVFSVPASSVFIGPDLGTPNYLRLAMDSLPAFPTRNQDIRTTYLVVPGERVIDSLGTWLRIIKMLAGFIDIKIVNSLGDAMQDMLKNSDQA